MRIYENRTARRFLRCGGCKRRLYSIVGHVPKRFLEFVVAFFREEGCLPTHQTLLIRIFITNIGHVQWYSVCNFSRTGSHSRNSRNSRKLADRKINSLYSNCWLSCLKEIFKQPFEKNQLHEWTLNLLGGNHQLRGTAAEQQWLRGIAMDNFLWNCIECINCIIISGNTMYHCYDSTYMYVHTHTMYSHVDGNRYCLPRDWTRHL